MVKEVGLTTSFEPREQKPNGREEEQREESDVRLGGVVGYRVRYLLTCYFIYYTHHRSSC